MDKPETYFLNGQQSKSLRLQLFTCFQSQQRITGRVYSEWPTLIIWPTFFLKINNFFILFFFVAIFCVIFYRIFRIWWYLIDVMLFQCKRRSTTVVHITKGTCGSYTASICWVLLCTVCCICTCSLLSAKFCQVLQTCSAMCSVLSAA